MIWRKSSRSGGSVGGNCVECATGIDRVHVRDSKDPNGPVLSVSGSAWGSFLALVSAGESSPR